MFLDTSKSLAVAKRILEVQKAKDDTVTPMQLIKLVYVAHGLMLGAYGRPLINESVDAWEYGPVIPSVYHATKEFRSSPVKKVPGAPANFEFDSREEKAIQTACRVFGSKNGVTLSEMTHRDGTPWSVTWSARGKNATISDDLIENYYSGAIKQNKFLGL